MLNKLDNKLILDRDVLEKLIAYCVACSETDKALSAAEQALDTDLTGWVATVAKPTREMAYAGRNARLNTRIPPIMDASVGDTISFRAMLNASPPLLETKRETK